MLLDITLADVINRMRRLRAESLAIRMLAFAVQEERSVILDYPEAGAYAYVKAAWRT